MTQVPKKVLRALERGWSVIPVGLDKRPLCGSWKPFQKRRATLAEVTEWQARFNPPAWAVITGEISGIVILDFDGEAGAAALRKLALTAHVRTGSGGFHVYLPYPGFHVPTLNARSKKALGMVWPGCDIRGDGGYAVFCGRNEKGEYKWLKAPEAAPVELSALPNEFRHLVGLLPAAAPETDLAPAPKPFVVPHRADSRAEGGWLIEQALSRAPRDGRNNSGFWLALQLRDNGYGEGEAERALLDYQARCPQTNTKGQREPYTVEDARKSLRAAYSHAPRAPIERGYGRGVPAAEPPSPAPPPAEPEPAPEAKTKFNRTDLGNAERFECRNRANVHYSKVMDRWFIWDGKRFQPDEKLAVVRLAADTVRSIYREAAKEGDDEERRRLIKHAMASESRGALSALVDLARSRPRIAIAPSELDADPLLLNCDNGTLDLQTGELREHRKADLITKLIPIPYHPQAACPYWIEFLHLIMAGDEELVKFLQRAVGYSLSGDVSERVLFFCHGSGRNGKSTFLETVHLLTGDYGMKTPSETLMYKREGGINNDVARLKGARYVYASETQEGGRLNEEQAKNLTGEAVLSARFLYSEIFEFRREFKLWLASNHLPSIHGGDKGIWDRIRKIPFQVRIPDDKLIKRAEIDARFRAELPGILAWAVAGCREYLARGLQAPAAVMAATAAYQADMDVLGQFLDERCVVNPQLRSKAKELYEDYKKWTEERGEKYPMKQTAFGLRLAERGFEKGHTDRGNVYYGLGLAAEGFEGFGGDFDKTARSTPAEKSYAGNRLNPSNPSASEENKATYAPEEEVIV